MGVGIARSQSFPRPMSINGLVIPLWESGYLISWVSGSQAERLVSDYFQIIPRCIFEMPALRAGDMGFGMGKRAAIQLSQPRQPVDPVDTGQRHRRAAGLVRPRARHRGETRKDRKTWYKQTARSGRVLKIIECQAGGVHRALHPGALRRKELQANPPPIATANN